MRLSITSAALALAAGVMPGWADDVQLAPAHTLPPAREAAWIAAVQGYKTDDGTTVLQALRYAESLRPDRFKLGDFQAVYNGGSGEPDGVAVDFWIGAKREPDDAFSFIFNIQEEAGTPLVQPPTDAPTEAGAKAVASGRDKLLRYVDEEYRDNCIDADGAKRC